MFDRKKCSVRSLVMIMAFMVAFSPALSVSAQVAGPAQMDSASGPDQRMPGTGNVTVNFRDVDIGTVLHYLSEVSGLDIVPSPGVEGTVTMRLRDKPWEVALDIITRNYGYVASRERGIIRIIPKAQIHAEAPVTEVIPLNHMIREVQLTKRARGEDVLAEAQEESVNRLLDAIRGMMDRTRGESVTFIPSVNSLVITAIPSRINTIKNMIGRIDRKTPQIMLDAKVVEISLSDDDRFGVDWQAIISAAGAKRPMTFPFDVGAMKMGGGFFPDVEGITSFDPQDFDPTDYAQDFFRFGTLDFSTFQATLNLLEERDDAEILSSPRITTLNNRKAVIKVIEKIMLQEAIESTETSSTVTVQFEREEDAREVGVMLTVVPHVNEEGDISVNLFPEVSTNAGFQSLDVGADAARTVALTFNSREANTTVRVRDGETIFIGGLIRRSTSKRESRLPVLGHMFGDVPLVGSAFKYESEQVSRSEVAFFVTVNLVEDGAHSMDVSRTSPRFDQYLLPEHGAIESRATMGTGVVTERTETIPVDVQGVDAPGKEHKPFFDFRKKD